MWIDLEFRAYTHSCTLGETEKRTFNDSHGYRGDCIALQRLRTGFKKPGKIAKALLYCSVDRTYGAPKGCPLRDIFCPMLYMGRESEPAWQYIVSHS